jgi:carbon monoxide dehydrogenase subunit G
LVVDVSERIDVAPVLAWKHLIDWRNAAQWLPGVETIQSAEAPAVGSRIVFVARGKERSSTITALEPGRAVTLESTQGGVTATYRYTIEPSDPAGAVLRLRIECDVRGPLRLIAPVIRSAIRKTDGAQPSRFRAWVERAAADVKGAGSR